MAQKNARSRQNKAKKGKRKFKMNWDSKNGKSIILFQKRKKIVQSQRESMRTLSGKN
jgi:hypothetical protein